MRLDHNEFEYFTLPQEKAFRVVMLGAQSPGRQMRSAKITMASTPLISVNALAFRFPKRNGMSVDKIPDQPRYFTKGASQSIRVSAVRRQPNVNPFHSLGTLSSPVIEILEDILKAICKLSPLWPQVLLSSITSLECCKNTQQETCIS